MELPPTPSWLLLVSIFILLFMSGYFSGSETAMMKVNPYRLLHRANQQHRGARRTRRLLKRQDHLLGVILIGNNLVNNCATLIAGVICFRWFGDLGYPIAAVCLTLLFLVFAELAPKTIAAERPETIAYPSSLLLGPLLRVLLPVVRMVNFASRLVVGPFVRKTSEPSNYLSVDELRTVVGAGTRLQDERQEMLLGVLDLERETVDDIMVQKAAVSGIDLSCTDDEIAEEILNAQHTRMPVYERDYSDIRGVLHLRRASRLFDDGELVRSALIQEVEPPYFIPEGIPLTTQLIQFRNRKSRLALVVDEYGDFSGIVTLEDILEEIVGEFTTTVHGSHEYEELYNQGDGSWILPASSILREINAELEWDLPTTGPRTLNGLMLEAIGTIPESNVSVQIGSFRFETIRIADNRIKTVRVMKLEEPAKAMGGPIAED